MDRFPTIYRPMMCSCAHARAAALACIQQFGCNVFNLATPLKVITIIGVMTLQTIVGEAASFIGLGIPPGATRTGATAISDDGTVVVGFTSVAPTGTFSRLNAFRWSASSGFQVLGGLPGGIQAGIPESVSNNSVIVGAVSTPVSGGKEARWTELTGWEILSANDATGSRAFDVSADGVVIVGRIGFGQGAEAFRWTQASGMESLGNLPNGGGNYEREATAISADGNIIVGWAATNDIDPRTGVGVEAFRWTANTGMVGLGHFPGEVRSYANDISANGSVIVGESYFDYYTTPNKGFRWTQETGMVEIPRPNGFPTNYSFVPSAVSGNGSVILGRAREWDPIRGDDLGDALIWDAVNGTRVLEEVLINDHGLAHGLGGWTALEPTGVSADGRVIVGIGINPSGVGEAWVAHLDRPANAPGPPGNFNGDGYVDAADYVTWRNGLGSNYTQDDYDVWKSNFGKQRLPPPRGTPVSSVELSPTKELQSFIVNGATYTADELVQPTMIEFAGRPEGNSIIASPGTGAPAPGGRSELLTTDLKVDTGITNPAYGSTAVTLNFSPPLVNGPGPELVVFEITRNDMEAPDLFQIQANSTIGFLGQWGPQLSMVSFDSLARNGGSPANISELENDAFSKIGSFTASPLHGMAIDLDEFGVGPLEQISTIQFGSFGADSFDPILFMGLRSAAEPAGAFTVDGVSHASVPEPNALAVVSLGLMSLFWLHFGRTAFRVHYRQSSQ
jgi:probable HAF family extracellular repeat protein